MQSCSGHWAEQKAVWSAGSGSLKKECKNPESFRSRKGSKGSGFLFSVVMQWILPYSEGEDADDAVPCSLERRTGGDAAGGQLHIAEGDVSVAGNVEADIQVNMNFTVLQERLGKIKQLWRLI